jgi:hypothetical protein
VIVTGAPAAVGQDPLSGGLASESGAPLEDAELEPPLSGSDDAVEADPPDVTGAASEAPSSAPLDRASPDSPLDPPLEDADAVVPSGDPPLVAASLEPVPPTSGDPLAHEAQTQRHVAIATRPTRRTTLMSPPFQTGHWP